MKITIKEIAKRAGVSTATVSRIINGQAGYNEETKMKVMQIIEETGYMGNASALKEFTKSKVDQLVALLVPDLETNFYAKIIMGIEDIARSEGYSVLICNTGKEGENALEDIKVLKKRKVSGIALIGITPNDEVYQMLENTNIPYILISTMSFKYPIPYIKVDSVHAAYTAVNYLIQQGHTEIAMITGTSKSGISNRELGYRTAMQEAGLTIKETRICRGDFSFESGRNETLKLLELDQQISAVFAASDDMALGVMSAAYEKGILVPEQLSVIGYDDTKIAKMSIPPLTTVAQPLYDMGQKGMKLLMQYMDTKDKPSSIILPIELKVRKTVKEK